ncbi:hypothetical protein SAMN04488038_113127 [Solimonas aquatica]|uniref:Uncharacterized protein n=1 Tax=Solimonas aquatica TaxID=489703 RepID=A0A1H9KJ63_9GAMM|nr:hypothetical protein SAMN04488038_113127 [Solimonas aquatica]
MRLCGGYAGCASAPSPLPLSREGRGEQRSAGFAGWLRLLRWLRLLDASA